MKHPWNMLRFGYWEYDRYFNNPPLLREEGYDKRNQPWQGSKYNYSTNGTFMSQERSPKFYKTKHGCMKRKREGVSR